MNNVQSAVLLPLFLPVHATSDGQFGKKENDSIRFSVANESNSIQFSAWSLKAVSTLQIPITTTKCLQRYLHIDTALVESETVEQIMEVADYILFYSNSTSLSSVGISLKELGGSDIEMFEILHRNW